MIKATIDFWKQLVKQYTKPLTNGLVINTLSDATRSRADLIAENALLRQQLIVLRRQIKRPQLTKADPHLPGSTLLPYSCHWFPCWRGCSAGGFSGLIQPSSRRWC